MPHKLDKQYCTQKQACDSANSIEERDGVGMEKQWKGGLEYEIERGKKHVTKQHFNVRGEQANIEEEQEKIDIWKPEQI